MTKLLHSLFLVLGLVSMASAQSITTVSVSPSPLLNCNPISVNVVALKPCGNSQVNPISSNLTGNTITVSINVTQGAVCTPIITYLNQTANLGNVAAGTYTLNVVYFVNGSQTDIETSTLNVGSCCSINTNFSPGNTDLCLGASLNFTPAVTSMSSYIWSVNNVVISTSNSASYTFNSPGTNYVKMWAFDGTCSDSTTYIYQVYGPATITASNITNETCPGSGNGSITVSASGNIGGPFTYLWSNGATSSTTNLLDAGTYTVTATSSLGCTASNSFNVGSGADVIASFTASIANPVCQNDGVIFTNTSQNATTSTWYLNGVFQNSNNSYSSFFNQLGQDTIRLIAYRGFCRDTADYIVNVVGLPDISSATIVEEFCLGNNDGSIDLTASGNNLAYLWSNGATTEDISGLSPGTYSVTLTANGACTFTDSFDLLAGPSYPLEIVGTDTIGCPGQELDFTVQGFPAASVITWTFGGQVQGNGTTELLALTTAGWLSVEATDGVCTSVDSIFVSVYDAVSFNATIVDANCSGDMGSITLTPSSGSAPFEYTWSTNEFGPYFEGSAGTYSVVAEDANGCTSTDTFDIVTLSPGVQSSFTYNQVGVGNNTFEALLLANVQSQGQGLSYAWTLIVGADSSVIATSPTDTLAVPLSTQFYICLTVTDTFGCSDSTCFYDLILFDNLTNYTAQQLQAYPNPVQDHCIIELPSGNFEEVQVQVVNALGQVQSNFTHHYTEQLMIPTADWAAGLYLVNLQIGDMRYYVKVLK